VGAINNLVKKVQSGLPGVLLLQPTVFADNRGFFLESYNEKVFVELGIPERFVQENHSYSSQNVLRGLGYQLPRPQGKLVRVITGEILDVTLDLRESSATFGKWKSFRLSGENKHMLWVPGGFAHGFRVVSDGAHVLYKVTEFYSPEHEQVIAWNDSELKIDWQFKGQPILSHKDRCGSPFSECPKFP
jgi:dTDP-4-dehydrorhamnose 3,5-epimerase